MHPRHRNEKDRKSIHTLVEEKEDPLIYTYTHIPE